jgi:hypothetical protein
MDFVGEVDDPEVRATIEDLNGAMPTLFDAIIIGDRVRLDQPVPLSYGKGKLDAAIRLLSEPRLQNVYVAGIRLLDIFLEVRGRLERGSKPPQ